MLGNIVFTHLRCTQMAEACEPTESGNVDRHRSGVGSGATQPTARFITIVSIRAPSGERPVLTTFNTKTIMFRSALPRGERRADQVAITLGHGFDPRSRVGSDMTGPAVTQQDRGFDPRSRVGSDLIAVRYVRRSRCFDPRSRVGGDSNPPPRPHQMIVSIQQSIGPSSGSAEMFRSTPPRRERHAEREAEAADLDVSCSPA